MASSADFGVFMIAHVKTGAQLDEIQTEKHKIFLSGF